MNNDKTFTNLVLIGPGAGEDLTTEKNLFILACDGIEYIRLDFSKDQQVLTVKDYGDPQHNVFLAIKGWVAAFDQWRTEQPMSKEEANDR